MARKKVMSAKNGVGSTHGRFLANQETQIKIRLIKFLIQNFSTIKLIKEILV